VGGSIGDLAALDTLGKVAEEARTLRGIAREAGDVQGFYHRVREASLTLRIERDAAVRERLAQAVREVTARAFAESLYGAEAATLWPALLGWLTQRRAAARSREPGAPPLACRLPVSRLFPVLRQAELWAALLQGTGAKGKAPLNVLLPWGNEPAGGIVILERDLRPDDVQALHPDPPGYDLLEDLRKRVPTGKTAPAAMELGEEPLSALLLPGALGD
jgi:hypothetical protein